MAKKEVEKQEKMTEEKMDYMADTILHFIEERR